MNRSEWAVAGGARCANTVFQFMVVHVLKAPLSYFESTPLGRILNRFTYDMEVIDLTLTESMSILMIATSWFTAAIIIMITIMPWIAFALVPALLIYWMLLLHYRRSGIDLQRIDAVARSPIQAMVSEGEFAGSTWRMLLDCVSWK
jgi:ABC-type multidrug transport system fused ATPase/permease subunit